MKYSRMMLVAAAAVSMSVGSAFAGSVTMTNLGAAAPPGSSTVLGKARWGASGFEGQLQTFAPATATNQNLNPAGTPVWSTTDYYDFKFEYTAATGTSQMNIDFNRDSSYGAGETLTNVDAYLVNKSFSYVDLWQRGTTNASQQAYVQNLTVNGYSFADDATTTSNTNFHKLFQDSSGQFGDIVVAGQFRFSGGSSQETPNISITLRDSSPVTAVPLPAAAWMGVSLLGSVGGVSAFRKRRQQQELA